MMQSQLKLSDDVLGAARRQYEQDGYCVLPPVLPSDLIARTPAHMQAVLDGQFETGVAPMWKPATNPPSLRMIDQAHLSDQTIFELVTQPAIGQAAAAVTGARRVQLWAVSLIWKPVGRGTAGKIGWHQDWQYFEPMWEAGMDPASVITAWVAVSHVTADAGPVRFVPGSHRWGLLNEGGLAGTYDTPVPIPANAQWREVFATLAPGSFSLHHALTYHGSSENTSAGPRLGFALHLCLNSPRPRKFSSDDSPGARYLKHLADPRVCPVLFECK